MPPRYLLIYKLLSSEKIEAHWLGRFNRPEDAETYAKDHWLGIRGEILSLRPETTSERLVYLIGRFFVRAFRIISGIVVMYFTYIWITNAGPSISKIPFSQMTFSMLGEGIIKVAACVIAISISFYIALGAGPDR